MADEHRHKQASFRLQRDSERQEKRARLRALAPPVASPTSKNGATAHEENPAHNVSVPPQTNSTGASAAPPASEQEVLSPHAEPLPLVLPPLPIQPATLLHAFGSDSPQPPLALSLASPTLPTATPAASHPDASHAMSAQQHGSSAVPSDSVIMRVFL